MLVKLDDGFWEAGAYYMIFKWQTFELEKREYAFILEIFQANIREQ